MRLAQLRGLMGQPTVCLYLSPGRAQTWALTPPCQTPSCPVQRCPEWGSSGTPIPPIPWTVADDSGDLVCGRWDPAACDWGSHSLNPLPTSEPCSLQTWLVVILHNRDQLFPCYHAVSLFGFSCFYKDPWRHHLSHYPARMR